LLAPPDSEEPVLTMELARLLIGAASGHPTC